LLEARIHRAGSLAPRRVAAPRRAIWPPRGLVPFARSTDTPCRLVGPTPSGPRPLPKDFIICCTQGELATPSQGLTRRSRLSCIIPTYIARERQRSMKVLAVVHWSVASPRTGPLKSAHAAHDIGGETHLPSKPPHTLTRLLCSSQRDFHRNALSKGNIWLKSGREKNPPCPPLKKGG